MYKKLLSFVALAAMLMATQSAKAEDIVISPASGAEISAALTTATDGKTVESITINLEKDGAYTITGSLVTPNSLIINGNGATIDASGISGTLISLAGSTVNAKKSDDTESGYKWYGDIVIDNIIITGLSKSLVTTTETARADKIEVKNSMIEFVGNSNIFALGYSFYKDLIVSKSTFWSKDGHTGYLIKSDARPNNLENPHPPYITTTVEKSTFCQISKNKQFNNSNGQMKGRDFLKQVLTESILVYSGNNNATKGWMFGQASPAPTLVFDRNTYWTDADYSSNWTGYDKSGTILTTFSGFADAENGDFTIAASDAQYTYKTGDPRWLSETITTAASGYTTLVSKLALDFTSAAGLEAYIAKSVDDVNKVVTVEPITSAPAGTPVILKGSASTEYIIKTTTTPDEVTGNILQGSATESTELAANAAYILVGGKFVKNNAGTMPAGKAYLNVPTDAPSLDIVFGGGTTGVNDVRSKMADVRGEVYNLAGQRVAQPTKGLYIVNGKKVIIK